MSDQQSFEIPASTDTVVVNQTFDNGTSEIADLLPVVVRETKAGYKTTEFWVAIGASLLTVIDGVPLPEKYEGVVLAAIAVAYVLARGIAKQGVPDVETPKA